MAKPATLVLTLYLLSTTLALSYNPELEQCKLQCQQQPSRHQQTRCLSSCEKKYSHDSGNDLNRKDPEQQLQQCREECQQRQPGERECQQRCEQQYQEQTRQGHGGGDKRREDPQQQLQQCREQCRQQQQHQSECEQQCEQQYKEQEEQGRGGGESRVPLKKCKERCRYQPQQMECEQQCEQQYGEETRREGSPWSESSEEQARNNPYFFDEQSFTHRVRTEEGNVRVLKRFSRQSELLRGIDNYRLAILDANPNTFVIPHHFDAEAVFYVVRGRGTINLLRKNNKESYNIRRGDILTIPAGTIVFLINKDSDEKLCVAKLLLPVSTPGRYREFFGAGGEDPESFYRSFSNDVLEAIFKIPRERLERLFGQQRKGGIIRASQEQIRAIEKHASSYKGSRKWPFGESMGPFNLLDKKPTHSNNYGELYEANADDYKQLRDIDVQVSYANISRGGMQLPFYNSKAAKVVLVVQGRGYFEMACPHVSSQRRQSEQGRGQQHEEEEEEEEQQHEGPVRYQRVRSRLSPNTVFIVPASHPIVTVASRDENLQMLCFEVNARDNQKYFLAGKKNILRQLEREEEELSFNAPSKEVEEIFNAQGEDAFAPGPEQDQETDFSSF
ncbi:vicilin Cor a 11.0101-like [Magnolia sinica]|uniref:vicilin Cor a 11.0101-like n=1 Tax=Magnolia sinica TaxID=86752 RepID=UPI002657AC8C|nr:vicilin Cor a 11.0101-like [Magnolia sinica]